MNKSQSQALLIKNGRVLLPDGSITEQTVLVRDRVIADIGPVGLKASDAEILDVDGALALPGLVDIHQHGVLRASTEAGALADFAAQEAACGATTFLPTFFGPPEETAARMWEWRRETDELKLAPQVAGFRLESPYLSDPSAGLRKDVAPISDAITDMLLEAGGGHIRIWDISPELPGAVPEIRKLSRMGIICSMAHTRASIEQARAAVDAGMRLVTHLFDTFFQPPPRPPDEDVYPDGLVDYLLVEDRVACEIIPDGTHVYPLLVEKTFRCKPPDKLIFITDSNYGSGLPPGEYVLPQGWGRVLIQGPNHGIRLMDRGMGLASSALTPIDAFCNAIKLFGKDLGVAARVCALNPARLLGLNKGALTVGGDADFVILDDDLNLLHTISAGRIVYSRNADPSDSSDLSDIN